MALRGSVARRYAKALFQLAVDKGSLEPTLREVDELSAAFAASHDMRQALENPVFRAEEKRKLLDTVLARLALSPALKNFAVLLLDRGRIGLLPAIARALRELGDEHAGRARAKIVSARPLDPASLANLQRALERRTGKKIIVETTVDPDLIGGVVARVGDLVLDGSVRTKLSSMKEKLLN